MFAQPLLLCGCSHATQEGAWLLFKGTDITVNGAQLSELCRLQAPGLLYAGQGCNAS